jgi:hypothetical protein
MTVNSTSSVDASVIEGLLSSGDLVVYATSITVNGNITNSTANTLTLKTTESIIVNSSVTISSQNGDLVLWSDSDSSAGGSIELGQCTAPVNANGGRLISNGGDIVIGGGADPRVNFATSRAFLGSWVNSGLCNKPSFGVALYGFEVNAGGGSISIRGSGGTSNVSTRAVLSEASLAGEKNNISTNGSGAISVVGDGSAITQTNPSSRWGVVLTGTDFSTSSGSISITGKGNPAGDNVRGFVITTSTYTSSSGDITFEDTTDTSSGIYSGAYLAGGSLAISTSGSITFRTDFLDNDATLSLSGGPAVIEAFNGNSFRDTPQRTLQTESLNAASATSLRIGKPGNTSNVTVDNALTIGGPLTIHGQNLALTGAVTATAVSLASSGATTQTGKLSASSLALSGSGSFTLQNNQNTIGTLAAGASGSAVGNVKVNVASGGLAVGQVGALSGITSSGQIELATLSGDLSITQPIVTSKASDASAVLLFADKDAAVDATGDGQIRLTGSGGVQIESSSKGFLFTGDLTLSTGLSTLVGGSSNVFTGLVSTTDRTVSSFSTNRLYALTRLSESSAPAPQQQSPSVSESVSLPVTQIVANVVITPGRPGRLASRIDLRIKPELPVSNLKGIEVRLLDVKGELIRKFLVPVDPGTDRMSLKVDLPKGSYNAKVLTVASSGLSSAIESAPGIVEKRYVTSGDRGSMPVLRGVSVGAPVFFEPNSARLTPEALVTLRSVAKRLIATNARVALTGFAAPGMVSRAQAQTLSSQRATRVAAFLKRQGVKNWIYVHGYGQISVAGSQSLARKVELRTLD